MGTAKDETAGVVQRAHKARAVLVLEEALVQRHPVAGQGQHALAAQRVAGAGADLQGIVHLMAAAVLHEGADGVDGTHPHADGGQQAAAELIATAGPPVAADLQIAHPVAAPGVREVGAGALAHPGAGADQLATQQLIAGAVADAQQQLGGRVARASVLLLHHALAAQAHPLLCRHHLAIAPQYIDTRALIADLEHRRAQQPTGLVDLAEVAAAQAQPDRGAGGQHAAIQRERAAARTATDLERSGGQNASRQVDQPDAGQADHDAVGAQAAAVHQQRAAGAGLLAQREDLRAQRRARQQRQAGLAAVGHHQRAPRDLEQAAALLKAHRTRLAGHEVRRIDHQAAHAVGTGGEAQQRVHTAHRADLQNIGVDRQARWRPAARVGEDTIDTLPGLGRSGGRRQGKG